MDLPRPTIDELITRYTLEPMLDDVFVEGAFDKCIFDARAKFHAGRQISVYEIDAIEVPASVLDKYQLTDGNKQRVIALGHELAAGTWGCHYRCIVDKDLDEWLGQVRDVERLIYTQYCDVEGYFLASTAFKHLIVTVMKAKVSRWELFFSSLLKALNFFYAVRLCAARRGWCIDWVELKNSVSVENSEVAVEKAAYILKILNKNCLAKEMAPFAAEVAEAEREISEGEYHAVRGHDLVETAAKCVQELKGIKEISSVIGVERFLIALAGEVTELDSLLA